MGYTFSYPFDIPKDDNGLYHSGVPAIATDAKGDFWVFQRNIAGRAQLYEYGPDYKLIRSVGDNVIGHQMKAHGMNVDASDNVWIADASGELAYIDTETGRALATPLHVGKSVASLVASGSSVWVSDPVDGRVLKVTAQAS